MHVLFITMYFDILLTVTYFLQPVITYSQSFEYDSITHVGE